MPQKISKQLSSISLLNIKRLTEGQQIFEAVSNVQDEYQKQNKMNKNRREGTYKNKE